MNMEGELGEIRKEAVSVSYVGEKIWYLI